MPAEKVRSTHVFTHEGGEGWQRKLCEGDMFFYESCQSIPVIPASHSAGGPLGQYQEF